MNIDLDELERLAEKATPGPWHTVESPWLPANCETYIVAGNPDPHVGRIVCDFQDAAMAGVDGEIEDDEWSARNWANAEYLARTDPATVLALIRAVRAAKKYHWYRNVPFLTEDGQRGMVDAWCKLEAALLPFTREGT